MIKLNKNLIPFILFFVLTGATVVAYTAWTTKVKKEKAGDREEEGWVLLKVNPWNELEAIAQVFMEYKPYSQEGFISYRNVKGEVEEEKKFKMICDSNIILQTIDFLTVIQGKNYEAIVDHDQQQITITPGSERGFFSTVPQLGLTNLKEIFEKGNYTWEVYQNGVGERMLYAPAFSNGTWTGLQIKYVVPGYALKSVIMGIPKLVSVAEEADAQGTYADSASQSDFSLNILSEGLEINYQQLERINNSNKIATYFNPDTANPVLMDKQLVGYRVVNYNRNKR